MAEQQPTREAVETIMRQGGQCAGLAQAYLGLLDQLDAAQKDREQMRRQRDHWEDVAFRLGDPSELGRALQRADEMEELAGKNLVRALAAEAQLDAAREALRELMRTSARQLNPTLATQAEWEAAERAAREALREQP